MGIFNHIVETEPRDVERVLGLRTVVLFCTGAGLFVVSPSLPTPPLRELFGALSVTAMLLLLFFTQRRIVPFSLKWLALFLPALTLIVCGCNGCGGTCAFWLFGFLTFISCANLAHESEVWGYGLFILLIFGGAVAALVEMFHIATRADVLRPYSNLEEMASLAAPALVGTFSLFVNHPVMGRMERYSNLRFGIIFALLSVLALGMAAGRSLNAFVALSVGLLLVLALRWETFVLVFVGGVITVAALVFGWAVLSPELFAASDLGFKLKLWGEILLKGGKMWFPFGRGADAFPFDAPSFLSKSLRSHPVAPDGLWQPPSAAAAYLYSAGLLSLAVLATALITILLLLRTIKQNSNRSLFCEMVLPGLVTALVLSFLTDGVMSAGVWFTYCGLFGIGLGLGGEEGDLIIRDRMWSRLLLCGLALYFCGFLFATHHIRGLKWWRGMEEGRGLYERGDVSGGVKEVREAALIGPTRRARFTAFYETARMARDGNILPLAEMAIDLALRIHPHSADAHLVAASIANDRQEKLRHLIAVLRYGVFHPTEEDINRLRVLASQLKRLGSVSYAEEALRWAEKLSSP